MQEKYDILEILWWANFKFQNSQISKNVWKDSCFEISVEQN